MMGARARFVAFGRRTRERFAWKRQVRRLEITRSGKWYIALTIATGVTALASGNNGIYLVESLLLAGLILSGIQSERQVSAARVEFIRSQAKAGSPTEDWIIVRNTRGRTLFCLEIGEWKDGTYRTLAFFPKIRGHGETRTRSTQEIDHRGTYTWDGFVIATCYPFGFAKKLKVVRKRGERVVWPRGTIASAETGPEPMDSRGRGNRKAEIDLVEGEIRQYEWSDDARLIVANQSGRGLGAMVRNRKPVANEPEILVDVREKGAETFENIIERAAELFYRSGDADLILIDARGRKKIAGKRAALNTLALLHPDPEVTP